MSKMMAVAGCKFYIGGVIDDQDDDFAAADFTSQTWVQVNGWTQMGAIGDTAALVTSDQIDSGRTKKGKGVKNAGSMQNNFDLNPIDAGQLALIAASLTSNNYAFKVELNDAPTTGSAPAPSQRLFIGLVMSASEQGGGANTPQQLQSTIEVNSNVVRVAATAGT